MGRIEYEKLTVEKMVRLYYLRMVGCSGECGEKSGALCRECSELVDYAHRRLEHCKFGEKKPTCHKCPIHCYSPDKKQRMREVMRWAGPRMMLYYPIDALRHAFCVASHKKR